MTPESIRIALIVVAALFVAFTIFQAVVPALVRRRDKREAISKVKREVARSRDASLSDEARAAALCEAAKIALEELESPRAAAKHVKNALDRQPNHGAGVVLAIAALNRARAHRVLERLLWRALDAGLGPDDEKQAWDALLSLYEGPLKAPERARVLARLRQS